jgi:hypothetical protein
MVDNTKAFPTATSQNTGEYFAVGSTIEVLPTTWDRTNRDDDITVSDNAYRTFKVLSHVSNVHGQTFAKLDSTPTTASGANYALKVTTHNSTVTTRTSVTLNAAQGEVQEIWAMADFRGAAHADDQYRIYINANKPNVEFTEILTGASTNAQVAEAINSFSALSGPVTVTGAADLNKISISFSAIDGDVPQLTIDKLADGGSSNTMSTETTKQGWSFFAGQSARLENVAPGSRINITSSEVVTFSISAWTVGNLVFSYDGTVAGAPHIVGEATQTAKVLAAITSIKDAKGASKLTAGSGLACTTASATSIVVTMPAGADGSKLELVPTSGTDTAGALPALVTKSVAKNNNGKSFKVLRVTNQVWELGTPDASSGTTITLNETKGPFAVGDEIRAQQSSVGTKCSYHEATAGVAATQYYAYIPITLTHTGTAGTSTVLTIDPVREDDTDGSAGCTMHVYRTTLVVDSKPDAFSGSVSMTIEGAKGSCSVSETVKGTYESDVCSSRGNCDGAAGPCTCHEGYSGEACETQTVLV